MAFFYKLITVVCFDLSVKKREKKGKKRRFSRFSSFYFQKHVPGLLSSQLTNPYSENPSIDSLVKNPFKKGKK